MELGQAGSCGGGGNGAGRFILLLIPKLIPDGSTCLNVKKQKPTKLEEKVFFIILV